MNERQNNLIRRVFQMSGRVQTKPCHYTKPPVSCIFLYKTTIQHLHHQREQELLTDSCESRDVCIFGHALVPHNEKKEQVRMHSQALKYFYITCSNDTVIKVPLEMYIYLTINPAEPKISNNITQDCDISVLHTFNPYLYTCVSL